MSTKMKIVFWDRIISPHKFGVISYMNNRDDLSVHIVCEEEISEVRKSMGLCKMNVSNFNVHVKPSDDVISTLLVASHDTVHIIGGFKSHYSTFVHGIFKNAIGKDCRIILWMEGFELGGVKGSIRWFRGIIDSIRYSKKIEYCFAIGSIGREYFKKTCFAKHKIIDAAYVSDNHREFEVISHNEKKQVLCVAQLIPRKNVVRLVEEFVKEFAKDSNVELNIIGSGIQFDYLKKVIKKNRCDNINLLGVQENSKVRQYIRRANLLVLPSLFDGWGAVITESLMEGTPVVCSNRCGASVCLDGNWRGEVFDLNEIKVLGKLIRKWINKPNNRVKIINWAKKSITGEAVGAYYLDVVTKKREVKAPWLL